jgi:hypothetical protein
VGVGLLVGVGVWGVGVWGCGGCGGWFPHAIEHSKVCTLCDFGHLQFIIYIFCFICSELFKAKTLEFFSKTLPILKADDTLPKVARYEENHISQHPTLFNSKPGR